jgi:hypothetical protein
MLNSGVLDVGVGLIFVYLILGLMCTTVHEWIAQFLRMRAKTLKEGIGVLLGTSRGTAHALTPEDINVVKLVNRLTTPNDKLAAVLGADPAIAGYQPQPDELANAGRVLAGRLNAALDDPALWQKIDLEKVAAKTLETAQKRPSGTRRQRANLALLREAYPEEIAGLTRSFYNHSLITSLAKPGRQPSYLPARTFATVLIDMLANVPTPGGANPVTGSAPADPLARVRFSISALPDGDIKHTLLTLMRGADNQLAVFQKSIETWFEDSMDRVSGWYKTKAQVVTVIVAFGITIVANADTIKIARTLFLNPVLREKIAQDAAAGANRPMPDASQRSPGLTSQQKADLGELTGWTSEFKTFHAMKAEGRTPPEIESAKHDDAFPALDFFRDWSLSGRWLRTVVPDHLVGWFLTAVAVSLGAPFWFDTLNRFMNIRAAGTAPNEKGQDRSKA